MYKIPTWNHGKGALIKRFIGDNRRVLNNFRNELRISSLFSHRNVLTSIGWCIEYGEHLIIYDFNPTGSLDSFLESGDMSLPCDTRYTISIQLASSVDYMHSQCHVLHGDIKAGNVLLDSSFNVKLSINSASDTLSAGVEYKHFVGGTVYFGVATSSDKAYDVHNLGIILLQLATGVSDLHQWESLTYTGLKSRVQEMYTSAGIHNVADKRLNGTFDRQEMERLILAGLHCTQLYCQSRPSAQQVFLYLKHGFPLSAASTSSTMSLFGFPKTSINYDIIDALSPMLPETDIKYEIPNALSLMLLETSIKRFSYDQLGSGTGSFNHERIIWIGGYGIVYHAYIDDMDIHAAVKRMYVTPLDLRAMLFEDEVRALCSLKHQNIVELIGICFENGLCLLVYELMVNDNLFLCLHSGNILPHWEMRYKIALDMALAILYIHEEYALLHTNITSSNVLLGNNNAKLTGFEAATQIYHEINTKVQRTPGYMDPEYLQTGNFTMASDIYSLGVVMLEIATGKMAIDVDEEGNRSFLTDKVWDHYKRGILIESADKRLGFDFNIQDMERLLLTGLSCTQRSSHLRPSIKQVVDALNSVEPLPDLLVNGTLSTNESSSASGKHLEMPKGKTKAIVRNEVIEGTVVASNEFTSSDILPELKEERDEVVVDAADAVPIRESNSDHPRAFDSTNGDRNEDIVGASSTNNGTDDPVISGFLSDKQNEKKERVVDSDQMILKDETFDIGIPPNYDINGPLKEFQLQFLKACANVLCEKLKAGEKFDDVLSTIKACTATLITLQAPLDDWISLTNNVLRSLKEIDNLEAKCNKEVHPTCSDLSSLKEEMERQITEINEDEEEIANCNKFLVFAQEEHASLSRKLSNLQMQIADIQEKIKDVEDEINSKRDSVNVTEGRRARRLEVLDHTKAEYSILSRYDLMISSLSNFARS